MIDAHTERLFKQNADTLRRMGAESMPTRVTTTAGGKTAEIVQEIGRRTIFGNPYRPAKGEELQGGTLEQYRRWLFAALKGDATAKEIYEASTGVKLPENYADRVREVADMPFYCPGCRLLTEKEGVCHGSILRKAARWLKTEVKSAN